MNFTHKNFADVLNKYKYNFNIGDIIAGTIFNKEKQGYLIDIGFTTSAYLPNQEISLIKEEKNILEVNNTQEFFILEFSKNPPKIILSKKRLEYLRSWDRIKQLQQENLTISACITGYNKGGLLINIENIQGFVPKSHLTYQYINKLQAITIKTIDVQFLLINEQTNQLIASNRSATLSKLFTKLRIGTLIQAYVVEVKRYGVFVDIYDIPALLHISEIEQKYASDIKIFFPIGKNISVKIIHIDIKQGRLSVSQKQLNS